MKRIGEQEGIEFIGHTRQFQKSQECRKECEKCPYPVVKKKDTIWRVSIRFHTKCKWPKARSLADTVLDRCSERITFGLDLIYLYWSFDTSLPIVLSNATTRGAVVSDLIHPSMKALMPSLKHFNKHFTCHLKLI